MTPSRRVNIAAMLASRRTTRSANHRRAVVLGQHLATAAGDGPTEWATTWWTSALWFLSSWRSMRSARWMRSGRSHLFTISDADFVTTTSPSMSSATHADAPDWGAATTVRRLLGGRRWLMGMSRR